MIDPCKECKRREVKSGVAFDYCNKKETITPLAIMQEDSKNITCFEVKE